MTTLTLIRGLPGSGKSTLAKQLLKANSFHIEADMYFVNSDGKYEFDIAKIGSAHAWCQQETELMMHYGRDVIVSNTFTTLRELRPYFDIASKYCVVPHVILCQGNYKNVHDVPIETMEKMRNRLQLDISSLFN